MYITHHTIDRFLKTSQRFCLQSAARPSQIHQHTNHDPEMKEELYLSALPPPHFVWPNTSQYQKIEKQKGGWMDLLKKGWTSLVAKYIQCTKYHNVVPCLQADQFNGQNPALNMLPPNVHILIERKRVYLLCSIGIFCADIPRQVGDERYYSNTTTVSQNHSIFPFMLPIFPSKSRVSFHTISSILEIQSPKQQWVNG